MTLIVGVVCKDAIVFGAESETTCGDSKFQGTKKISIVDFIGGSVIVGEAGIQHLSHATVDKFIEVASKTKAENEESIVKALETSFRETTKRTIAPRLGTKTCQDFYRQEYNYFEITLGFFCGGRPSIYILNPIFGIAVKCRERFSRSGIGKDLAEYLLKDFPFENMDSRATTLAVTYVVREAKTSVSGCGGNTEIALVSSGCNPEKLSADAVASNDGTIGLLADAEHAFRMKVVEELNEKVMLLYQSGLDETSGGPVEDESKSKKLL